MCIVEVVVVEVVVVALFRIHSMRPHKSRSVVLKGQDRTIDTHNAPIHLINTGPSERRWLLFSWTDILSRDEQLEIGCDETWQQLVLARMVTN